jgi:hypothetical protein
MNQSPVIILQPQPPVEFLRADGVSFVVSPLTRSRLDAADALSAGYAAMTEAPSSIRRDVLAALVGETVQVRTHPAASDAELRAAPASEFLDALNVAEEMRAIVVLRAHADGLDASSTAAIHEAILSAAFQQFIATQPGTTHTATPDA